MGLAEYLGNKKNNISDRYAKHIAGAFNFNSIYDMKVFSGLTYRNMDEETMNDEKGDFDAEIDDDTEMEVEEVKSPSLKVPMRENLFEAMQASFQQDVTPSVSPAVTVSPSGDAKEEVMKKTRGRPRKSPPTAKVSKVESEEVKMEVVDDDDDIDKHSEVEGARRLRSNTKDSVKYEEIDSDFDLPNDNPAEERSPRRRLSRARSQVAGEGEGRPHRKTLSPSKDLAAQERSTRSSGKHSAEKAVKNELIFSNKHDVVSDKVKHEVRNLINSNKLVLSESIRDKVQRGLLKNGNRNGGSLPNGFVQVHPKDSIVNGRKALNEISPTRTRQRSIDNFSPISPKGSLSTSKKLILSIGSPRKTPDKVIIDMTTENDVIRAISPGPETRSVRRRIDNVFDVLKSKISVGEAAGKIRQTFRQTIFIILGQVKVY